MAAKPKIKRRVPAVPKRAPLPSKTHSAGVGISVPIYLPVTLTPPYTITVVNSDIRSLANGRSVKQSRAKLAGRIEGPENYEYGDPRPPYEVKLTVRISKGRS